MSGLFFPVAFAVCDEPLPQKTCFAKQGSRTKFVGYFLIECRNGQLGIIYLYVNIYSALSTSAEIRPAFLRIIETHLMTNSTMLALVLL